MVSQRSPQGTLTGEDEPQQACLRQPFDRLVTYAAHSSSFAQADFVRIGERSFVVRNRIVATGYSHTVLIPPFPLSAQCPSRFNTEAIWSSPRRTAIQRMISKASAYVPSSEWRTAESASSHP